MKFTPRTLALLTVTAVAAAACSGGSEPIGDSAAGVEVVAPTTTPATTSTVVESSPGSAGDAAVEAPSSTTSSSSTSTTTTLPPIPRQPLTGEPLVDGAEPIYRPALAVKIDNHPAARPNHSGLAVADIVFEEIVEGQITRFAAIFHSRDSDVVGPIRSGRSQDVDLLTSFNQPLFAWSGGNPGVTRLIAESDFVDLNAVRGGEGYYRGPGEQPHDLYNSTERLWDQTPLWHPSPPPAQFDYLRPGESFGGDAVGAVAIPMRGVDVLWTWDADANRFLRSQEGRPHEDVLHGRIGAENVVVMSAWYRPSAIDANSPEAQTLAESAPLWVFSDGRVIEGRWYRTDATQPITMLDGDNRPIRLNPGTTWVELAEGKFSGDPGNPITDLTILPPD